MSEYLAIGFMLAVLSAAVSKQPLRDPDDIIIGLLTLIAVTIAWPIAIILALRTRIKQKEDQNSGKKSENL